MEIALKYKVKQSKTVNFLPTIRLAQSILKRKIPSVHKPLRIKAPPKISPPKRAFEKYKPRGLFSEFYGSYIAKFTGAAILSLPLRAPKIALES